MIDLCEYIDTQRLQQPVITPSPSSPSPSKTKAKSSTKKQPGKPGRKQRFDPTVVAQAHDEEPRQGVLPGVPGVEPRVIPPVVESKRQAASPQ